MLTQDKQLQFTGKGSEYFRIWIVNLILTLLTLGIFSAWAKVRRNQYFYQNTWLNESNFNYLASPISILKGKITAAILFSSYIVSMQFYPKYGLIVFLLLIFIFPLAFVLSMRFRLYNSSYRGLRFGFSGSIKDAYITLLFLPILNLFSLYFLIPFMHQRIKSYQHNNYMFGKSKFIFNASVKSFYKVYFIYFLQLLSLSLLFVNVFFLFQDEIIYNIKNDIFTYFILPLVFIYTYFLIMLIHLFVKIQNLVWNHTLIGNNQIKCNLKFKGLLKLEIINYFLIIITLSFYKPFADIRRARYFIENMAISTTGDFEEFIASEQQNVTAIGSETGEFISDIFNIDIRV